MWQQGALLSHNHFLDLVGNSLLDSVTSCIIYEIASKGEVCCELFFLTTVFILRVFPPQNIFQSGLAILSCPLLCLLLVGLCCGGHCKGNGIATNYTVMTEMFPPQKAHILFNFNDNCMVAALYPNYLFLICLSW